MSGGGKCSKVRSDGTAPGESAGKGEQGDEDDVVEHFHFVVRRSQRSPQSS